MYSQQWAAPPLPNLIPPTTPTTATTFPNTAPPQHPGPLGLGVGSRTRNRPTVTPVGPADPGTPTRRRIAAIVFVVAFAMVALLQQIGAHSTDDPNAPAATPAAQADGATTDSTTAASDQPPTPPGPAAPSLSTPFDMAARLYVKIAKDGSLVPASDQDQILNYIVTGARTPTDSFRAAVVAEEVFNDTEERDRLLERASKPTPERLAELGLDHDLAAARAIWDQGPASLDDAARERLIERHGWYARLLLTRGEPFTTGDRAAIVANGRWVIIVLFGLLAVLTIAVVGAIAAAIYMGIAAASGRVRFKFVPPAPGGSVYLETAALFVLGFLILKTVVSAVIVAVVGEDRAIGFILICQWLLLLTLLWPLVRGVRFRDSMLAIGFTANPLASAYPNPAAPGELARRSTVFREIGAGIVGYFAGLPLLAIAMGITLVIVLLQGLLAAPTDDGTTPAPPANPIFDLLAGAPLWQLGLVFLLATVWAPLAEEAIFRGCLYRHLRAHVRVLAAALVSALCFAFMHGYPFLLLAPVFTLGIIFALLREWRGSIIAPITAHALHNATVLSIVGSLIMLLRD
jgi:membrane protease YdiL (CAAX protease family)